MGSPSPVVEPVPDVRTGSTGALAVVPRGDARVAGTPTGRVLVEDGGQAVLLLDRDRDTRGRDGPHPLDLAQPGVDRAQNRVASEGAGRAGAGELDVDRAGLVD